MTRTIRFTAEIECPDEGYEDVCFDLIIADFMENPKAFGFCNLGDVIEIKQSAQECKPHQYNPLCRCNACYSHYFVKQSQAGKNSALENDLPKFLEAAKTTPLGIQSGPEGDE